MANKVDDGRVWGRPEALDTLGRVPGRRGRTAAGVVGVVAIAVGSYLAFNDPASSAGRPAPSTIAAAPLQAGAPTPAPETCASIAVNLPASRVPAEGILPNSVVRLSRIDASGSAQLLIPQAYVLRAEKGDQGDQGGLRLSVLVRSGSTIDAAGRDVVDQINGANADGSLVAAILYDINADQVLDECRRIK